MCFGPSTSATHAQDVSRRTRRASFAAMRKPVPDEIRVIVVELLLGDFTPQDIAGSELAPISLGVVQRFAREEGLARPRGGARPNSGGPRPGAGAKPGSRRPGSGPKPGMGAGGRRPGSGRPAVGRGKGTPHKVHAKWSPHREEAKRLRAEGNSLRQIMRVLGLRSAQSVANLLVDEEAAPEK